ncbi:MAG: sigma 54-interacting transcriptional regulator [Planctomycetota bacterium]
MNAFLTILSGSRAGTNFPVDPAQETLIGRGTDCHVSLPDPMCSRVHAILAYSADGWVLTDQGSRNGTQVNGQKVKEATLADGNHLKLGSCEFEFHLSDEPATTEATDLNMTQTIVHDMPIALGEGASVEPEATPTGEKVQELILLYQLSNHLLGCNEPDEVVRLALELLRERTRAAVTGFLWADEEGQLRPKQVIPADEAQRVVLSASLTELVLEQGRAVWVANQSAGKSPTDSIAHYADAVCAPLVRRSGDGERKTMGAIHVYLQDGRFRQSDFDFIISVANLVVIALVRAISHTSLQSDVQRLAQEAPGSDELIGESKPMRDLKGKIQRVAKAPGCVLVRGESGSGKELVARAIHLAGTRADRPMVSVNCAAIPRDLMESQLFGHKAGSFTGADRDHTGFFQQADLGSLFLDEVGELTLEGQAKLLRILEGHPFLPVGATEEVRVDVRVIAATNRDLQAYVGEGKFREDLYYRLSVFELHIAPLRDRGEDIELLIRFFLDHYRAERGRPGLGLSDAALKKMTSYNWPGNVRQLRNVIDSAVVLAAGDQIEPHDLGLRDSGAAQLDTLKIEDWEKKLILEALSRTSGNVPEAAKLLGIGRATLYRKIETYHIER